MCDTKPISTSVEHDELLLAEEVAEMLKIHVTTVYRLAQSGDLRAHRIGGGKVSPRGLRIPRSAVTEYLSNSLIAPAEVA